ncbi:hypothetical protein, partial [Cellulosimicrobium cellulans]|uniref:hypothetical protein n=1 Tax=Cellulosimicrobium cellulans TaxID=1710 RepID=UPI001C0C2A7D
MALRDRRLQPVRAPAATEGVGADDAVRVDLGRAGVADRPRAAPGPGERDERLARRRREELRV